MPPSKTSVAKRRGIVENEATICAVRVCPPRFGGILVNGVCECTQLVGRPLVQPSTTPTTKRQKLVQEDEAHICAVRVCPPRFGGVLVNGVCKCTQLVGVRPATILSSKPTVTPTFKRQALVEENEAHICAVRVCPPRFGGVIVNGVCECTKLVGLPPSNTISSTEPKYMSNIKRQEIVEDEDIICAVRVCPPRFGAIIVDGVCTCTRFGLPPPSNLVKRSSKMSAIVSLVPAHLASFPPRMEKVDVIASRGPSLLLPLLRSAPRGGSTSFHPFHPSA